MQNGSSVSSSITSSSHAISERFGKYTKGEVGRYILGDIKEFERCEADVFGIKGRATKVFGATSESEQTRLVAKLYWPNQGQLHEMDIINRARKVSPDLPNHLPCVFGSRDFDLVNTGRIMEKLGISSNSPRPHRNLRIMICEYLHPITERQGDNLLVAWLECIRSHHILWNHDIRHQDLSLANLMVWFKDGQCHGVVNDWDLSFIVTESEPRADLTGTVPFMALNLLNLTPQDRVIRYYYHDLESFLWILIWVFLAVKDKKVQPTSELNGWQTSDMRTSFEKRAGFLLGLPANLFGPQDEWANLWGVGKSVASWLRDRWTTFDREETPDKNKELLSSLLETVRIKLEGGMQGQMPSIPAIVNL